MKISALPLTFFFAFFSHVLASPTPQGGTQNLICGGPDKLTCPPGYRCCIGPLSPTVERTGG
ncbi:hypothetical protein GALMADRAFT_144437 [Galerina marginata CBS 339.88]|uniref:CBM1 domain-containing protein n=1 Tax=Galerina marginata (strain CBS 339.88) TaxID=685588 RepID=A0A067SLV3_GALM3|nr:hypothetical protein GALMADRAFT_144437 [Galerina marginata CBS 339.88]